MIHFILAVFGIVFTIFFVIGTHESAHFIAARLLGVKVLRFSIGFGKTLYRWYDKKGTEYVLALIPLGGYVKMLDQGEGDVAEADLPYAYNVQPFYKKFIIVAAGPLANILCALALYWLVFMIGFVTIKPIIGSVAPHSIAAESGLKPNQEILRIDDEEVETWTGIVFRILAHAGDQDRMKIEVKNPSTQRLETHVLDLSNWHIGGLSPDLLGSLGLKPFQPPMPLVIGFIGKESPAAFSPLKLGDKILAVNKTPIMTWEDLITTISNYPDETVTFTLLRAGKQMQLPVAIGYKRNFLFEKSGYLGIAPHIEWPKEMLHTIQYGPLPALTHAWGQVTDFTYYNLLLFGKMVTGKLSTQSLGGPITIFQTAGDAINYGFVPFIGFLAFLSISIGIINLLPVPGLDGGHLFIQIIEFIIRRPIPDYILNVLLQIGLLLIFFVLIQAIVNDVLRLY